VPKTQTNKKPNRIAQYFRETIGELRKVSWPTLDETMRLAVVVIIVMIVASIFLGSMDILLERLVLQIFA
jgi:preprotein translocase subunit SecE